ncbi:MAG: sulfatase [Clostridia bacterium]
MKAIMLMFDSLNRHMLSPYDCDDTITPNFKRLAERAVTFDNAYVASMPCMPARREIHTGRLNFLHRSWGPLEPFDDSMPEILKNNGVYTHLVTDHYHYFEDGGATYHNRYSTWESVRGQEGDPWKASIKDPEIPQTVGGRNSCLWRQDWVNREYMKGLENHPQKKTLDLGLQFIDKNRDADNWMLQIETFDPHEPFFAPDEFRNLYPEEYDGLHFDWPNYVPVTETAEQVKHVRKEYHSLLTMCDYSLGRLLDKMDEYHLWDDTMLIVNTDHGFLLGEHDWWAKCVQPWYNENALIPLFIWDPRAQKQNERREALVQGIDIAPTLLEYFGLPIPEDMQGKPLKDTVNSDVAVRDACIFGIHGGHVNVTDGRYVYMRAPVKRENTPLYNYTLMPCHMRNRFSVEELSHMELSKPLSFTKNCQVLKVESHGIPELDFSAYRFGTMLFDVKNDPQQQHPIQDERIENRMIALLIRYMKENDSPPEQFERLGL